MDCKGSVHVLSGYQKGFYPIENHQSGAGLACGGRAKPAPLAFAHGMSRDTIYDTPKT
jgi:hypothetical protein